MSVSFLRGVSSTVKSGAFDYCQLETANDKYNLVTRDGAFVSVLDLRGTTKMVGSEEFGDRIETLYTSLSGALTKPGYRLQFVFVRDPGASHRETTEAIRPAVNTFKRLEVDFVSALVEKQRMLSKITSKERGYLVVTTTPGILPPVTQKSELKGRIDKKSKVGIKPGLYAQSPLVAVQAIRQSHESFRDQIIGVMGKMLDIQTLEVHDALRAIRMEIDPDFTDTNWRATLPGDRVPTRMMQEDVEADLSWTAWPAIGFQVAPRDIEINRENTTTIRIGERHFAPLLVDMPPQEYKSFVKLFDTIDRDVPWRWSLTMDFGHDQVISKVSLKRSMAMFLAFSNSGNKLIVDAANEIIERARDGEKFAIGYMSLVTWGGNPEVASRRRSMIAQAMQAWGSCEVQEEKGDPVAAFMNSVPAMSRRPIGTPFPVSLADACVTWPISRPASPWTSGSILFKTLDGKLYPFQPGSSKQTMWIDLIFARPGSGKSVFLNATNMALISMPGQAKLPRIGMIDIGHSSAAFSEMVKQSLPKNKRYLVEHFRLRMTKEYAINPFDTPLGCRYPLAIDRSFILNFMTLLLTPVGSDTIQGVPELVSMLIDGMYKYFDENGKRYEPHVDAEIDRVLDDNNIELEEEITWWEVVDILFDKGLVKEASLAQRHAVPLLADATTILSQDHTIKDMYAEARTGSNEPLLAACGRMISSAIRDYPILASPSMFDTGEARIVSLDLAEVAKTGGEQADRQSAVMYLLARYILCKDFYRDKASVTEMPERVRRHHLKRIEAEMQIPKKICFDEFHRTKKAPIVRDQVVVDMREGRKFNVHVALASQREEDFTEEMVDMATNVFILDKGTASTIRRIRELFSPPEDAIRALKTYVTGPTSAGVPLLYIGVTKGQDITQILQFKLGPQELWAYSTTVEDVAIRTALAESVGLTKAIKLLAKDYPGGSARNEVERRRMINEDLVGVDEDEAAQRIIVDIVKDLRLKI